MGKSQSNSNIEKYLEQTYKYIRRYSNGCYGYLTVIEKKSNRKLYALKEYVTEQENIDKKLFVRKSRHHPGLIRLCDYWIKEETSLCSNLKQVYLLLDYEELTLEEEVQQRQYDSRPWTNNYITGLLASLVSVLVYLFYNGMSHNCLNLKTVLVNRYGEARLLYPYLVSLYSTRSYFVLHNNQTAPFQPPYILHLTHGQLSYSSLQRIDFTKVAIFSLGIVILALHFLNYNIEYEIFVGGDYDFYHLKKLCRMVCYSNYLLVGLLPRMLKKEPEKRPDLYELKQFLTSRLQKENANLNSLSFKYLKNTRMIVDTKAMLDTKIIPSKKIL